MSSQQTRAKVPNAEAANLLVVIGAGASYDSIRSLTASRGLDDRPPLASQLFAARYDPYVAQHPACGALVAYLRQLPDTTNLEAELDRIQSEEMPVSAVRRRQVISLRYYLRDVLAESANFERRAPAQTNYHLLLEQLLLWQERTKSSIALVTFNYDTMIEKAMGDLTGRNLGDMNAYVSQPALQLFKPHGSINWGRIITNERGGRSGQGNPIERYVLELAGANTLAPTDEFVVVDTSQAGIVSGDRVVMPALTVPVQRKQGFEFPLDHQERLKEVLSAGAGPLRVLTIGWRAGEENFLSLWLASHGQGQPRLLTVNGHEDQGRATIEALRAARLRFSEAHALPGGFSHLLGAPLEQFLTAPLGRYPSS